MRTHGDVQINQCFVCCLKCTKGAGWWWWWWCCCVGGLVHRGVNHRFLTFSFPLLFFPVCLIDCSSAFNKYSASSLLSLCNIKHGRRPFLLLKCLIYSDEWISEMNSVSVTTWKRGSSLKQILRGMEKRNIIILFQIMRHYSRWHITLHHPW